MRASTIAPMKSRRLISLAVLLLAAISLASCHRLQRDPSAARPRIASGSPAITDILIDMELEDHVVAVSRYCTVPEGQDWPKVCDALQVNSDAILAVDPDVILTQSSSEDLLALESIAPNLRIEQLRLETLTDVSEAITRIGRITGRSDLAADCRRRYEARLARAEQIGRSHRLDEPLRVLFLMGTGTPLAATEGTFVDDMIYLAGAVNAGRDIPGSQGWQQTEIDDIRDVQPDVIICQVDAVQGPAARDYWLQWQALPASRSGNVHVVTDAGWTIPSTALGDYAVDLATMISETAEGSPRATMTLWRARVYRWLAAAIAGAALAAGGMALQGLLRNPLAEPYLLGVSSGAGVGVLLGLALGSMIGVAWLTKPILAFAGATATCGVVYMLARRKGRLDPISLILSGVIINIFNGAIMLIIYMYIDPFRIADFAQWMMGRLPDSVDPWLLAITGGLVVSGWLILILNASAMNVLSMGDSVAASSGVSVHRLRLVTFGCVGMMTAAAVALAGPIGFLGLIVPHICRMVVGPDLRVGIFVSGLVGAILLVAANAACRYVGPWINVSVIPVGIVTALAGGPFFLLLLRRQVGGQA
jgi:iron complex transport system permease protein